MKDLIRNPYTSAPHPRPDLAKATTTIGLRDKSWFHSMFPALIGPDDKILAILYSALISELRIELDEYDRLHNTAPDHAWEPLHPYWTILHNVLQRLTTRLATGHPDPRDVGRRPGGVHKEDGGATQQCPDPQSIPPVGSRGNAEEKGRDEKQRGPGDGSAVTNKGKVTLGDLFKQVGLDESMYGVSE